MDRDIRLVKGQKKEKGITSSKKAFHRRAERETRSSVLYSIKNKKADGRNTEECFGLIWGGDGDKKPGPRQEEMWERGRKSGTSKVAGGKTGALFQRPSPENKREGKSQKNAEEQGRDLDRHAKSVKI